MSKQKEFVVDDDLIASIVKMVIQQMGQQGAQQTDQQIADAVQQAIQKIQGSQQEKSSMTETKQEEIMAGEAIRAAVVAGLNSGTRKWDFNDKALVEKSQDFDRSKKGLELEREQIVLTEERAKAAKVATLQHVESMMGLLNVYAQIQSVADQSKFNSAVSEPISPNTKK